MLQSEADMFMNDSDKNSREQKLRAAEIFTFLTNFCSNSAGPMAPSSSEERSAAIQKKITSYGAEGGVESLESMLAKLKDEEYVREHLKPETVDGLTPEQEEFIMYLRMPQN